MRLNELRDNPGARKSRMRVGRGLGSGKGKTSGSGQKGQKARKGVAIDGFEGGQMPLYRRLPKRGFTPIDRQEFSILNLETLQQALESGRLSSAEAVDETALRNAGMVRGKNLPIRLLAKGEIRSKIQINVHSASKKAVDLVEKVGGKVTLYGSGE